MPKRKHTKEEAVSTQHHVHTQDKKPKKETIEQKKEKEEAAEDDENEDSSNTTSGEFEEKGVLEEHDEEQEDEEDEKDEDKFDINMVGEKEIDSDSEHSGEEEEEVGPLPVRNAEVIQLPVMKSHTKAEAYAKLIDNSPLSRGLEFESGYHPPKVVVEAICRHGKFTNLTLLGGDWEAWLGRFPRIMKRNPHLKRVILANCPQSGCSGYDSMIYACMFLPELAYLDISENEEEMDQGKAVAYLLAHDHPSLKYVNLANNQLEDEQLELVVKAIKGAARRGKLVLENLEGIDLNEENWRTILGLSGEEFETMSNEEILRHLKK